MPGTLRPSDRSVTAGSGSAAKGNWAEEDRVWLAGRQVCLPASEQRSGSGGPSRPRRNRPGVSVEVVQQLVDHIAALAQEVDRAWGTIRRQEAELATQVGVTLRPDEQQTLLSRLEQILQSGAVGAEFDAAALYLLDEGTSELKLRASWGLPASRLADPGRPLRGALADLEALLGNAVLLDDVEANPMWASPEAFPTALVVPIGSPSMPHGTLWLWSRQPRKLGAQQIEVANLAASRLMAELERQVLCGQLQQSRHWEGAVELASVAQADLLPGPQPLHQRIELGGWTFQADRVGGAFHDWDVTAGERVVAALGQAAASGVVGSLAATSCQQLVRSGWLSQWNTAQIVQRTSDLMWGEHEADWRMALGLMQLNPRTGHGQLCVAGPIQAHIVSPRGFRPVDAAGPWLAEQPQPQWQTRRFVLQPGEVLLVFSRSVLESAELDSAWGGGCEAMWPAPEPFQHAQHRHSRPVTPLDRLLSLVHQHLDLSAEELASWLARLLPASDATSALARDRSLVVCRHQPL
jgi:phosphoserine phosphatase RsbU/P